MAVPLTYPFTLSNGTTGDASQVMANFNAVLTTLATNAAKSGVNSDITALSALSTPLTPSQGGTNVFIGGTSGGSANVQTINVTPAAGFSLTAGYIVTFTAGFSNTGALTLNVNGAGAKNVLKCWVNGYTNCTGFEMVGGAQYLFVYDGAEWVIVNPSTPNGGFQTPTNLSISSNTLNLPSVPSHFVFINNTGTVTTLTAPNDTSYPIWLLFNAAGLITFTNSGTLVCPFGVDHISSINDLLLAFYAGANVWYLRPLLQQNLRALTMLSQGAIAVANLTNSPTAGGNINNALLFGNPSNGFGIYYGSGPPTIVAAQGSLYLRTDGSSTTTRAHISKGATWAAITTDS